MGDVNMYIAGDQIIHPRYGAGIVTGEKAVTLYGKTRKYHIVELVGNRGEVMIPLDSVADMDIRPAIKNMDIIEETFSQSPVELSDDYRTRQAKIEKQIKTRQPESMAEALRDLAWREHTDKLTSVELKMKSKLMKMLSREIAVIRPTVNVEKAMNQLTQMLYDMLQLHEPPDDEVISTSED
jgi:RNA polymerase-interacting CarD/CdnL/TRCF family regulator